LPGLGDLSLYDFIPRLSPSLAQPRHLHSLVDELETAISPIKGQRFFWFSVPPRHWKTFTLRGAIAKHLVRWPEEAVAYLTHTQSFANKQSREVRKLARQAGLEFARDSNRQDEWELKTGGGLVARGIEGEATGRGFRLIVIDDPIKGRETAESAIERERIFNGIEDDFLTRLAPDGSVILVHTRWHPDDPIGRYKRRDGWRGINIKALGGEEEDQPLLPDHWPFETLDGIRRSNVYKFSSLYQGEPRPRGGARFGEAHKFEWPDARPVSGYQVAYGVDLAYTAKTHADFSVCVKLLRIEDTFFVVDVRRAQVDAPSFTLTLNSMHATEPGPMLWYASGTEKGAAQFIQKKIPAFRVRNTTADKFVRSEAVSEAWNAGKILVPGGDERPAWVDDFVDELTNFTGVKDPHDDQVDALAAAFDLLNKKVVPPAKVEPPRTYDSPLNF
jgi:predicted phage terminase large subunit-like protein